MCAICYFSGLYVNIRLAKQIMKSFRVFEETLQTVNEHRVVELFTPKYRRNKNKNKQKQAGNKNKTKKQAGN